ncbi:MAG: L-threonylcarbamoyladenylate synthase [Spirochaetia bacterium]|nr:L-threonylcarbamoyladenylate synthase [Spirochaetia bacterium]
MKPPIYSISEDDENFAAVAADILEKDGVIAFPTDSIYGLLIKYTDENAKKLHAIRNRPVSKPFIALISSSYNWKDLIDDKKLNACADAYIETYWPGKLSLILPKNPQFKYPEGETIAVRMPKKEDNVYLTTLLEKIKFPVLAPSANLSGDEPLQNPEDIQLVFQEKIDAVFSLAGYKPTGPSDIWDLSRFPFRQIR